MPFRSKAQLRKFGVLVRQGKISKAKFRQWIEETPNIKNLPERVGKKRKKKTRRKSIKSLARKYAVGR